MKTNQFNFLFLILDFLLKIFLNYICFIFDNLNKFNELIHYLLLRNLYKNDKNMISDK